MVRMKVAKSEPTFSTPTLAKIAVSAANAADSRAHSCHDESRDFIGAGLRLAGPAGRSRARPPAMLETKL